MLSDAEAFPVLSDPVTRGALCQRGWSAGELFDSPLRILGAQVRRRGGPLAAATLDAALGEASARLATIRSRLGASSIGILGSARLTLEEQSLLADLARAVGTPHLDSLQRHGCVPGPSLGLDAIERASRLLVVGTDLAVRHPQAYRRVLAAIDRGATVRCVGGQAGALAALAAEWIRCLPGGEAEAAARAAGGDDLVIWSSEPALHGQAGPALRRLAGAAAARLPDYVNQRGLLEAGVFPGPGGLSAYEMLQAAAAGAVKVLLIFGEDPFEFFPELAARAFAAAECVVVTDAVRTRAADAADIVLPGALLAEKGGTVVGADGSARAFAAARGAAAAASEREVARRLLAALGGAPDQPARAPAFRPGPDGPAPDAPSAAFPLMAFLDASTLWGTHPLVCSTVSARREALGPRIDLPDGWVSLSPADARAIGVRPGWTVRIESDAGGLDLAVRTDRHALDGTVGVPMHCWERAGTTLGALALDPCLRIPVFRPRAVRLVRR